MKKIYSISLLLATALGFTGCAGEEDDLFDQSAAERLNAASALYSARLGASPNGWSMQYYPTTDNEYPYGSGYLILMDFDPDGSVNVAMNNVFTYGVYAEDRSLWEVITDDGPVLSFNSYNTCMHAFSNPEDIPFTGDSESSNNEQGTGVGGDYEFIIVDAPEDASYMMLKGKKRGTYNLLTPIEEGVDYKEYLDDVRRFNDLYFSENAPTYNVVHFGDSIYKMEGANDGIPNIYPFDGDAIANESFNPFLITKRGNDYYLRFRDKKEFPDGTVIQDFRYDVDKDVFESVDNANYYIMGDNPARFYQDILNNDSISYRWQFDSTYDNSTKVNELMNAITAGFQNVTYTFTDMALINRNNQVALRVRYRAGRSNATIYFLYDFVRDGDNITLQYRSAEGAADAVKNTVVALGTFVDSLSQTFTVEGAITDFDLTNIRLTSVSDPSFSIITRLY